MDELNDGSEKSKNFSRNPNDDPDYIRELFCNTEREEELENVMKKQWYEMYHEKTEQEKDLSNVLYKIHYELNTRQGIFDRKEKSRSILKVLSRVAAVLFIPLLIYSGFRFFQSSEIRENSLVEIKAPAWTQVEFNLPDGTKGWLNSKSSIKYQVWPVFNRKVTLNGEAFFDVAKDRRNPFNVITDKSVVTVLGTRFNISSYDNEIVDEIVLEEGSLSFSDKDKKNTCLMSPGEIVTYNKLNGEVSVDKVQTFKYTSWKEGKLVFRDDPLDVVARRLERWFDIEVELKNISSDKVRLRATFIQDDLQEVLNLLKRSLNVDYQIIDRNIGADDIYIKKKVILTHK